LLQFGLVWMISSPKNIEAKSFGWGLFLFCLFTTLVGITTAPILYLYTGASAGLAFFTAAGTFGAAALWGYVTKMDLTKFGGFLFMAVIGLIIALFVNIFLGSTVMQLLICLAGVAIFIGVTAWDIQVYRMFYRENGPSAGLVVSAALGFFLD